MELLRRESDYALRCLVRLARAPGGRIESARRLAQAEHIPEFLLKKTLQKLARAGIVKATLGAHGGFQLRLPSEEVTVLMVVEAVQGPVVVNRCFLTKASCPNQSRCCLRAKLVQAQEGLKDQLSCTTIRDLTETVPCSAPARGHSLAGKEAQVAP